MPLYSIQARFPASYDEESLLALSEALSDLSGSVSARRKNNDHQEDWVLEWFCVTENPPERQDVTARLYLQGAIMKIAVTLGSADISIRAVPEENWLEKVYAELKPFSVGPFYIYGSHVAEPVPDGQIGLRIDAVTAFGSGEHGTTKGCLQAMLDLKGKGVCPWNVLDMGTGTGILAIAAYKLWHTPVSAVDIDRESIRVACKYRALNDVPADKTGMLCKSGDGFQTGMVQARKPFDLVIANILAGPLVDMAADLADVLDDAGHVILSGMLNEQAAGVQAAYETQGLVLRDRIDIGKWTTLVLQKG